MYSLELAFFFNDLTRDRENKISASRNTIHEHAKEKSSSGDSLILREVAKVFFHKALNPNKPSGLNHPYQLDEPRL